VIEITFYRGSCTNNQQTNLPDFGSTRVIMRVLYLFLLATVLAIASYRSDTPMRTEGDALLVDSYDITASQKTVKLIPFKGLDSGIGYIDTTHTNCPEGPFALTGNGESALIHRCNTTISII